MNNLKILDFNRIDVPERIDLNNTGASRDCIIY